MTDTLEQPITQSQPQTRSPYESLSSVMVGASMHSAYSGQYSTLDYVKGVAGAIGGAAAGGAAAGLVFGVPGAVLGGIGGAILGVPTAMSDGKYLAAALVSGGTSFANTVIQVSNWFGSNKTEEYKVNEILSDYDTDLGKYYRDNEAMVDLGGFVLGSFAPLGLATKGYNLTTKMLSASKAGTFGKNMESATGLLAPAQNRLLQTAVQESAAADNAFTISNTAFLKAFAIGVADEAALGAVQSMAVLATMKASPILNDMDMGDMANNVLEGALLSAGIGGVIRGVRMYHDVKSGVVQMEQTARPYVFIEETNTVLRPSDKLVNYFNERDRLAMPIEKDNENFTYQMRLFNQRKGKLDNLILEEVAALTGKDSDTLTGVLAADLKLVNPDEAMNRLFGVTDIAKINTFTKTDELIEKANKKLKKGEVPNSEEMKAYQSNETSYLDRFGQDGLTGETINQPPETYLMNLADRLKTGETISVSPKGIKWGKRDDVSFSIKPEHQENFLDIVGKANPDLAEAAHIWAQSPNGAKLVNGMDIREEALHLLKGAVVKGLDDITVLEKGVPFKIQGRGAIRAYVEGKIEEAYTQVAEKLIEPHKIIKDPEELVAKLAALTGKSFKVGDLPEGIHAQYNYLMKTGKSVMKDLDNASGTIMLGGREILKGQSLAKWVQTVEHEAGHRRWQIASVASGFNPDTIVAGPMLDEMTKISRKMRPELYKDGKDLAGYPLSEAMHEKAADTFMYFALYPEKAAKEAPVFFRDIAQKFAETAPASARDMMEALRTKPVSIPEVSKYLDVDFKLLEKQTTDRMGFFKMQQTSENYTAQLVKAGLRKQEEGLVETSLQPRFVKVQRDTSPVQDIDGNLLKGIAAVKERQRLAEITASNAVVSVVKEDLAAQMANVDDATMSTATKQKTQGALSAANSDYGTLGSVFQWYGTLTEKIHKSFIDNTVAVISDSVSQLKLDKEAAVTFSAINSRMRGTPEKYYLDEQRQGLVLRRVADPKADQTILDPDAAEFIKVENATAFKAMQDHMSRQAARNGDFGTLRAANGVAQKIDPRAYYPLPVNQRDYPYFAFVSDPSITGQNKTHMIYAASEKELDRQITDILQKAPEFKVSIKSNQAKEVRVFSKKEVEDFYRAQNEYNADDVISDNFINTALFRKGVSAQYLPPTDSAKIADDLLSYHTSQDGLLARYAMTTRYQKQFAELNRMGESFTNLATSKVSAFSLAKFVEQKVENPYQAMIRTALNVSDASNAMPMWSAANSFVDKKFSEFWRGFKEVVSQEKSTANDQLDQINGILKQYGIAGSYESASAILNANHTAAKGSLMQFSSRANAILASTVLRLDPMNAINNVVGSPILTFMEMNRVLKDIANGSEKVGALAKIKVPGTGDSIFSVTKAWANASAEFISNPETRAWAAKNGFSSRYIQEFEAILDDLALTGKETAKDLDSRIERAYARMMNIFDKGESLTGNKLAEQFNRGVSAIMMKNITDEGIKQGVLTEPMALSYINTFVNRTQGNYHAAQRPYMFQGPVGQMLGLFQTYQFNMLQQVFRHIGEGQSKTAAMALGIQTSIYGMQSLPGFDYINAHVVGTMSGNKNNRDFYDATYGIAGKEAGDWITYGMLSNVGGLISPDLKVNLYTRGDMNPRFATVIPLNPVDYPVVQMTGKFLSSLKETVSKIGGGGDAWTSVLQGIEHSGLNRPLAGLAQSLQALGNPNMQSFSTSNKGNVIASNDLLSLANAIRITGAKPFSEAQAIDAAYRLDAYKDYQNKQRKELGEVIKTTVIAGGIPSEEQMNSFASKYAELGGSQSNFAKYYMSVYGAANTSQANKIAENLKSPYSQSMQTIMNGNQLKDFRNYSQGY